MKRFCLAVFVLLVCAGPAPAQGVRFGAEGGLCFSNLRGDLSAYNTGLSTHLGIVGGLFAQIELNQVLSLRPEVLYSQEGTAFSSPGTMDLSYLEVPVLLRIDLPLPSLRPGIFAGAAIGFNTLAQAGPPGGPVPLSGVNGTEESLIFGAGLDLDRFSFTGRYQMGLSDIGASKSQNGALQLMVGYFFI